MARPRGGDWLEDEIKWLSMIRINNYVSLLESSEVDELELAKEAEYCKKWNVNFISYPIKDVSIPQDESKYFSFK